MTDLHALIDAARAVQERVVDLRRRIHAEPELGLELPDTRAKILAEIDDLGLDVSLHERTSGVVATLRGAKPGRRILLRGDMDALPMPEDTGLPFRSTRENRMHACGHDAHVAMLAGAARVLAGRRDELEGEVVFMFQPGEEGHAGAAYMLSEGVPEVDGAFALHVWPMIETGVVGTRPGPLLASADEFEIRVRGRGGHASMPHDCRDPIPAACEIVAALQAMVTREIPVSDPVVLTVTQLHAGTTGNVIPESAKIGGTLRALSAESRELVQKALPRVAEGVATAHGVSAEVRILKGYPVTRNDAGFEAFARGVASELLGAQGVFEIPAPIMGAEDFSYVLERFPGAMVMLGVKPAGESQPEPCHSNKMMIDEDGLVFGTALHAAVATRFLAEGPDGGAG